MERSADPLPPNAGRLMTQLRETLAYVIAAARLGAAQFQKKKTRQIAAALTYHTLFSLLPAMALALVVLRTFVGPAEQLAFKDFIVNAAVEWLVAEPNGASGAGASEFDATIARIDETVLSLLDQLQTINFQSIGVVGVLLFLFAATGLLVNIEQSFNQIYGVEEGRPWYYRLPLYYTTITLAPLILLAGQVLQERAVSQLANYTWISWLTVVVSILSPILTTWVVFYLMYLLTPNARVNLRSAAVGALLAATASVLLQEILSIYTSSYVGTTLYGSMALLPLAMLWMWLNWIIILSGLQVSYVLQTGPAGGERGSGEGVHETPSTYDPRWLLLVLSAAVEAFKSGKAATVDAMAQRLRLTETFTRTLAEQLVQVGFLHRIVDPQRPDGGAAYAVARTPEDMEINALFSVWPGEQFGDSALNDLPGSALLSRLEAARAEAFRSLKVSLVYEGEGADEGEGEAGPAGGISDS